MQQLVFSKESSSCSSKCRLRAEIFIKFDTDQLCQLIMRKFEEIHIVKDQKNTSTTSLHCDIECFKGSRLYEHFK